MNYTSGKPGRVFVLRLSDGEPIYEAIEAVAQKESIRFAQVMAVGGMRRAKMVVGPKETSGKIEPIIEEFDDAREIVGLGTIAWDEERPILHFHSAIGRKKETLTGCPRIMAETFLVLEVVITEIEGVDATRELDPGCGAKLLEIGSRQPG